tara:strand:+ start:252 stop:359 length:108 start_codon:yes stop_codon:yes gene_type:complete
MIDKYVDKSDITATNKNVKKKVLKDNSIGNLSNGV